MHFAQPLWIVAAICGCVAFVFAHLRLQKRRRENLESFVTPMLRESLTGNVSESRRRFKLLLVAAALFFSLAALARPQYGHRWIDVKRRGIDILFAVDTSASMLAEDIRPNRLERSKLAIQDFIDRLDGDRVGLIPFAGSAFLMCPLTIDYTAFAENLHALDTAIIPEAGTNLERAIDEAGKTLDNNANHKLLIIVTDGEHLEGDAFAAAERADRMGMRIFTVGVGTSRGELVPLPPRDAGDDTGGGHLKDEQGQFVISRLDETSLRRISQATDGLYAPLGSRGQGLESIYRRKLTLIPKEELVERRQKVPVERFPWFLAIALVLLLFEYLLTDRKRAAPLFSPPWKRHKSLSAVLLLVLVVSGARTSSASPGEEAFSKGDFQAAARYYEQLLASTSEDVIHYNYGTAAYKRRLYDEAIAAFTRALDSDNPALQEKAYYNRGNAHYKKGEESLLTDVEQTLNQWQEALRSYEAALALHPDNVRAGSNYQTVKKKLEELEEQRREKRRKNTRANGGRQADEPRQQPGKDSAPPRQEPPVEEPPEIAAQQNTASKATDTNLSDSDRKREDEESPASGQEPGKQVRPRQGDGLDKHQALQLLEEMKNEEGTFTFAPRQPENIPAKKGKNW